MRLLGETERSLLLRTRFHLRSPVIFLMVGLLFGQLVVIHGT